MARSENNLNAVLQDTANAIRGKTGGSNEICPRDFADEIGSIQVGIIPSGTKTITANGSGIDVYNYASVDVNVPNPSTGTLSITSNGTYDVSTYAQANVNIPVSAVSMTYPSTFSSFTGDAKTAKTEVGQSFGRIYILPGDWSMDGNSQFGVKFSNSDQTIFLEVYAQTVGATEGKVLLQFNLVDSNGNAIYFLKIEVPKGYYFDIPWWANGGDQCYIREWKNGLWYDTTNKYVRVCSHY